MIINFNTITSNFNGTKAALAAGVNQGSCQALRACKAIAKVSGLCLKKAVKAPFLLKNFFIKRAVVNDSLSLTQQEVRVDPLKGSNPLIEDISQGLKKTVILYKQLNSQSGDLAEKAINQIGCLLEKTINQKPSIEDLPSLDQLDFGKLIDTSLRVSQKFFPKEFLRFTGRNKQEKEITEKLESLLACLQHFEIPYFKLSKTFTPSDVDSMIKQLKLVDKGVQVFIKQEIELSEDACCLLMDALGIISELQSLLEEYQRDVNKPIGKEDRIFAKDTIENNPLATKVVSPTVIALGSVATPLITIDGVPYLVSKTIDCGSYLVSKTIDCVPYLMSSLNMVNFHLSPKLIGGMPYLVNSLTNVINLSAFSIPVLQKATIATASYALSVNYAEEEQEESSLYMINSLFNQAAIGAFAYIGARMCGSKIKVKEFVEQRISSLLTYKTCNNGLEYLGISFWPNKAVSAMVSGLTNRILH